MKKPILTLLSISAIFFLAACAGKQLPPKISYDHDDFSPAVEGPEPLRPVEIVKIPEILPLPGQLKPRPVFTGGNPNGDDDLEPRERVDDANQSARMEPDLDGYINAIQVYPYTMGALYQLYAAPEKVTDIALQPGEALVSVSAGDTVRWVVGDTTSGDGDAAQVHILVKPIAPDLTTNLVVTTDRRTYHVEMQSADDAYMASLSWRYPHDDLIALSRRNVRAVEDQSKTVDSGLNLQKLRFRYQVTGDDAPWQPLRAFDDGKKVYIEFPAGIVQGEAPPLFVVGPKGDAELVNYRVKGRYYVVDRLFAAAELRLGDEPQQIVRISRTDGQGG